MSLKMLDIDSRNGKNVYYTECLEELKCLADNENGSCLFNGIILHIEPYKKLTALSLQMLS